MIGLAVLALMQAAPAELGPPARCYREETHGGVKVMAYTGDRTCVDLAAPRPFDGVWLNDFEGSRFVEGAKTLEDVGRSRGNIWLNRHDLLKPSSIPYGPYGRAYRVRFIGRAAKDQNRPALRGYGHFGMSNGLVVVDELQRMDDIGSTTGVPKRG